MLRKIPVEDLRPGMYITDNQADSLNYPLLYCGDRMLEQERDIESIRENGYTEALVDLSRGDKQWMLIYGGSDETALLKILADAPPLAELKPKADLQEELPKAKLIYAQAVNSAQRVMEGFRNNGKADIAAGNHAVEGIVDSVARNANALLAISKLRARDDYTFSHCINVATAAVIFARLLGFADTDLHAIGLAGFFHDLGKMGIPLEVLNSPNKLTPEEFDIMRAHPVIGYEHLKNISELSKSTAQGALEHHERFNGKGYPHGKKGDEISLTGKILAVVDVYDALSSRRVYKEAMSPHSTLGLIYGMRGQDFMPELVDRFIQCIGIYPAGSLVKLSSGHLAVVEQVDPEHPLKPRILLVRDSGGKAVTPTPLDMQAHSSLQITTCLDAMEYKLDPLAVLEQRTALKR